MECWTLMSALAASTRRIRLISMVSCVYYRSPFMLARQAADVDRISGGRLVLGVGIGDDVPEFAELGLPFERTGPRQRAMEDTVRVVQALWRGEHVTGPDGTGGQLAGARLGSGPVQEPHVPVLIGGGGERTTLRQVAELADVSNFAPHEWAGSAFDVGGIAQVRRAARLLRHGGPPYEAILRSHFTPLLVLAGDEQQLARKRRDDPHPRPPPVGPARVRHPAGRDRTLPGPGRRRRPVALHRRHQRHRRRDHPPPRRARSWPALKVGTQTV